MAADPVELELQNQELRRAQIELQAALDRYAELFELAPVGYLVLDGATIRHANRAAVQLFGGDSLIGAEIGSLLSAPDVDRFWLARERTLEHGVTTNCEVEVTHGDGTPARVRLHSASISGDEPDSSYCLTAVVDMTGATLAAELSEAMSHGEPRFASVLHERERLDRALRRAHRLEAVGRLASGVAHDFNNLLMGIAGCADIALHRSGDDDVSQYIREIKSAAAAGRSIAEQLLSFGRDRGGTRDTVVELDQVVAATTTMLCRLVGEDVETRVSLGAAGAKVPMARGEVDQVLMNLVANARDAMPDGGTLTITTRFAKDERASFQGTRDHVVLTVTDDGVGMGERALERAHEPFFTTKALGRGEGLGLSAVFGIARRARGRVEIESEPGKGTSAVLWLPCTRAAPACDGRTDLACATLADGTVLVAEDEPLVLLTVRHYLENAGFRVLSARTGPEAEDCCARYPGSIDVLLTDVVLPGMSGQNLAARARALKPGVRTVYMSAHARETLVSSGRLAADADLLHKPFVAEELVAAVNRAITA